MEFEKLKKIIAEVLNVDPDEITMETTFQDDLGVSSKSAGLSHLSPVHMNQPDV